MNEKELIARKAEIEAELIDIEKKLRDIERDKKPYVAEIYGYASPGVSNMRFKTEEQARKKYNEYRSKRYFRNGLVYGVVLYKNEPGGGQTLIDSEANVSYWKCPYVNEGDSDE